MPQLLQALFNSLIVKGQTIPSLVFSPGGYCFKKVEGLPQLQNK